MSNSKLKPPRTPEAEHIVEAHHRIKNTLQNIISYINVMFGAREQVSREQLQKLIRYVHALSIVQDILLSEYRHSGDNKMVRIDRIATNVLELASVEMRIDLPTIPQAFSTIRRAATLCLVLNEILDNGKMHGIENGEVRVVANLEDQKIAFAVISQLKPLDLTSDFALGSGLRIASLLSEKDLDSSVKLVKTKGEFVASFSCPCSYSLERE